MSSPRVKVWNLFTTKNVSIRRHSTDTNPVTCGDAVEDTVDGSEEQFGMIGSRGLVY